MLQEFYPSAEAFYECEICHEPITNPICPVCLAAEIDIWSTNYPNLRRELLPELKKYIKKLKKQSKEAVQCIKCNEKRISVCAFCFMREVLDKLEDLEANKIIKKEFLQFFNYYSEPYKLEI